MPSVIRRITGSLIRNRKWLIHGSVRNKELLDIGCGSHIRDGFITLDYNWRRGLDICWDVSRGLPLRDETISGVFSEHCLEHLPLDAGDALLREVARVLKPGGTLRLIVPDGELYMARYAAMIRGETRELLPYAERDVFAGIAEPIIGINRLFNQFGHQFIYDFRIIRRLLLRHGFVDIERSGFGRSREPRLVIDTERRAVESLYVEASKAAAT